MKILVVDDEPSLAENIAEILVSAGHEVAAAGTAEDALARLSMRAYRADALLTDYRLPGATGIDLIRTVRGLGSAIPALVITAVRDERMAASAVRAGAADVFTKPVDLDRLLKWVSKIAYT